MLCNKQYTDSTEITFKLRLNNHQKEKKQTKPLNKIKN